jgi:hypothetical protein
MINSCRDEKKMKALSTKSISEKLKEEGYYNEVYVDGAWKKEVLPEGIELGIFPEERTSKAGLQYVILMYNRKAQEFIVESLHDSWLVDGSDAD